MTDPNADPTLPPAGWYDVDGRLHYWDGAAWLNIPSPPTTIAAPEPVAAEPAVPAGYADLGTASPAPASSSAPVAARYAQPSRRRGLPTAAVVAITAATTAVAIVGGYLAWQWVADIGKREDIAAVEQTIAVSVRNGEQVAPAAVDDVTCTPISALLAASILDCTVTFGDGTGSIPWYAWTNHDTGESWHGVQPFPLISAAWD